MHLTISGVSCFRVFRSFAVRKQRERRPRHVGSRGRSGNLCFPCALPGLPLRRHWRSRARGWACANVRLRFDEGGPPGDVPGPRRPRRSPAAVREDSYPASSNNEFHEKHSSLHHTLVGYRDECPLCTAVHPSGDAQLLAGVGVCRSGHGKVSHKAGMSFQYQQLDEIPP
jgi:hypothetical protein